MLRLGSERGVVLHELPSVGIDLEKLKAKQAGEYAANLVGHIVRLERSLDHLEDARLVFKRNPAGG